MEKVEHILIKVSRAWVETSSILRMSLPVEPPKSLKALKTGPLKNRLSKAINMAEQAKMMRKEERLEKYSFATLFKGKWGLHPDTDSDEDEDDGGVPSRKKVGKKPEPRTSPEPRKEIVLQKKKKKRTKTTPKIIRPDIFSDDDDASTIVSRSPYKPKTNGIREKEQTSSDESSQDDHSTQEPPHDDHSEQENDKESDEKDSTVDEALLNEALNYEMPEMYELHSERPKKGKRSGLPMPRKIKVRSSLLLLLA